MTELLVFFIQNIININLFCYLLFFYCLKTFTIDVYINIIKKLLKWFILKISNHSLIKFRIFVSTSDFKFIIRRRGSVSGYVQKKLKKTGPKNIILTLPSLLSRALKVDFSGVKNS